MPSRYATRTGAGARARRADEDWGAADRRSIRPAARATVAAMAQATKKRGEPAQERKKREANALAKGRRKVNSHLLAEAKRSALVNPPPPVNGVTPEDAFQEVMEDTLAFYRVVNERAGQLDPDSEEFWRQSMAGTIPNEWIRLADELRRDVAFQALKAMSHGLEERQQRLAEAQTILVAELLRSVVEAVGLNKTQRGKLPKAIKTGLKQLEASK